MPSPIAVFGTRQPLRISGAALLLVFFFPAAHPPASACTGFLISDGKSVLAGNNEDYWNPNTEVRFVPAGDGRYGRVYFGFDDGPLQGGMNEKGLFFDGFATAPNRVETTADLPTLLGNPIDNAMALCATVDEVVDFFHAHDRRYMERFMLFFGDASGDAVIIEGDKLLRKSGPFQVITNFYQSETDEPLKACGRYRAATGILEKAQKIDVELCIQVLDSTHADGRAKTLYSNVYDLKKRIVYVYHFFDFEKVVVFDLEKELAKGARTLKLPELFPLKPAAEAFRQFHAQTKEDKRAALKAVKLKAEALERCAGTFRMVTGDSTDELVELVVEEGTLKHKTEGGGRRELIPQSKTRFTILSNEMNVTVVFEGVTETSSATGFVVTWDEGSARAERVD